MAFTPVRNPDNAEIARIVSASKSKAARRIYDAKAGVWWYWPAEQATHAEGAALLEVEYNTPPGLGDIVTL